MGAATGSYELFRWKSSRGRLVVRTTWVKGVRHVILSDDDEKEKRQSSSSSSVREKNANRTAVSTNRQPLRVVSVNENCVQHPTTCDNNGDDNYYVERVLQWLQKPSTMLLETQRKSVSAPGNSCNGNADRSRRPALVKTCSIPETNNKFDGEQQVVEIAKSSTKSTRRNNSNWPQNHHKIELHVHIPSTCTTSNDNVDNGKIIKTVGSDSL